MCFAPQGRELFRHLNFQKCSGIPVFCTSWLSNVLRATTVCTFSTSQLPKVVRIWGALYILTSKCTSHHNGVHFFDISTSKTGPRMVCLVHFDFQTCFAPQRRAASSLIWPDGSAPVALASLLFDPPEPQIIGKTVFRGFPTFSRICIFFLLTLSLLLFSLLIFLFSLPLPCCAIHLSILSEVWLLNFLRRIQLHYITQHHTTLITLHYATTATTATLHYTTLHYSYNYATLHCHTLDYTTLYHATLHNITVHYNTLH